VRSTSEEFANVLGSSIKKAAEIALEYYPYTPMNPRPDDGRIGRPIKPEQGGKPAYRYRQKLARYTLNLWAQLDMPPCKPWQWGDKETPIVQLMNILTRVIEPSIDAKETTKLLKAAGQWEYISPEEAAFALNAELPNYRASTSAKKSR
jgi:hypothetical protein